MIRGIKEASFFLLSHPEDGMSLPDTALINYGIIKINKTGIYLKALERWNTKDAADRIVWANFRTHMIEEYEKLPRKRGGTTLGQEGYGGAFNAT